MSNNTAINTNNPKLFHQFSSKLTQAQLFWRQLSPGLRRIWLVVGLAVSLYSVWLVAIAPAMNTLRNAPDLHRKLDAQIDNMQTISAEVKSLQKQPKLGLDDAQKALQNTVAQRLGSTGQINIIGSRAILTLKSAPPQSVAEFLTEARINARAIPQEVKITRNNASVTSWDGSMTLSLPAK
ncbi:MAG TPA: type II secretion system protein GspM [Burkholderiaceae bacterium]|nr:type II secretion system protein GspM [Burkholderiaceae bacterium]